MGRTCIRCGDEKAASEFYSSSSANICKICWRAGANQRYAEKRAMCLATANAYYAKARSKCLSAVNQRRATKFNGIPPQPWANQFFIEEIYDLAHRRSRLTGIRWDVDHIVPLRSKIVCGLHVERNLQVITHRQNCQKRNFRWPDMP